MFCDDVLVTSTPTVGKLIVALKKFVPLSHIGILVVLKVLSEPDGVADTQKVFVDDNGVDDTILKCLEPVIESISSIIYHCYCTSIRNYKSISNYWNY